MISLSLSNFIKTILNIQDNNISIKIGGIYMKNLVTENKDINKSVSLRLNKSLLEEINKITEVFSISLTDFIRNAIEKEVKEIKNDFFFKLSQVDYCSNEESKEIIEELNKMTEDDLKVTKIKSITLKK